MRDFHGVAGVQAGLADLYRPARDVNVSAARPAHLESHALGLVESRRVHARVLLDPQRPSVRGRGGDQSEAPGLVLAPEVPGLNAWREAWLRRPEPDLQQVRLLGRGQVRLAVLHTGSGADALHVASAQKRLPAQGMAALDLTLHDESEDFHLLGRVGPEGLARLDAILVDHAQRPELHVLRIEVVREREAVEGLEPAVVRIPSVPASAYL